MTNFSYPYFVATNATTSTTPIPPGYVFTTKPRRSYKKKVREVPSFTSGLEGKLYDALDQDASGIITHLSNKTGKPVIDKQYNITTYTFEANHHIIKQPPLFDPNFFDALTWSSPTQVRRSVQFKVKLEVRDDGTLSKFAFNYGAST